MALPQLSCHRDSLEPRESLSCLLLYKYINAGSGNKILIMPSAYTSPHQKLAGKLWPGKWEKMGETRNASLMISTSSYKFYPIIYASWWLIKSAPQEGLTQPLVIWPQKAGWKSESKGGHSYHTPETSQRAESTSFLRSEHTRWRKTVSLIMKIKRLRDFLKGKTQQLAFFLTSCSDRLTRKNTMLRSPICAAPQVW